MGRYTIKAQKRSKDIVKIIHVTSGVLYEATRIVLCTKKAKIITWSTVSSLKYLSFVSV